MLYVAELLKNANYDMGNITELVNQQATKAVIVNAFGKLASESKRGDIIYIHFSGHG